MHSCVESYFPQDKTSHELPMLPKQVKGSQVLPLASTTKCQFKLDKKLFWTAQSLRVKNVHNFQTREGGGQGILCIIEVYFPQNGVQLYYKCNTCHSDYHSLYLYRILCTHESAICSTRPQRPKTTLGTGKPLCRHRILLLLLCQKEITTSAHTYESFSDLGEIRVWLRADFQSGSRVLKKVF